MRVSLEWRFYEAEFVKTRCENSLCFIFCSFLPTSDNNSPLWLWCLIIAAAFTPQSSNAKVSYSSERAT